MLFVFNSKILSFQIPRGVFGTYASVVSHRVGGHDFYHPQLDNHHFLWRERVGDSRSRNLQSNNDHKSTPVNVTLLLPVGREPRVGLLIGFRLAGIRINGKNPFLRLCSSQSVFCLILSRKWFL